MTPRFSLSPPSAAGLLALLVALAHGTIASAQGHTPDPYRPYNSMYEPFVMPTYPRADGYFPNQSRLTGRSGPARANQFQDFLDESRLGADPSGLPRSSGAGVPYYRAHRRFDPNNRPNNSEADRLFRERQAERDARYFEARKKYQEALNERDPQKRAQLTKEYAAAKRLAEQDFQRPAETSTPGPGTDNPPPRRPQRGGTPASTSPAAPSAPRDAAARTPDRPRSTTPAPRPGGAGLPPAARTPSQILQESESLDRTDRTPSPPRPRLQPAPAPR